VHVGVKDPDRAVAGVEKALKGAQIPSSSIRKIEPSLEDIFVSMVSSGRERGR